VRHPIRFDVALHSGTKPCMRQGGESRSRGGHLLPRWRHGLARFRNARCRKSRASPSAATGDAVAVGREQAELIRRALESSEKQAQDEDHRTEAHEASEAGRFDGDRVDHHRRRPDHRWSGRGLRGLPVRVGWRIIEVVGVLRRSPTRPRPSIPAKRCSVYGPEASAPHEGAARAPAPG
jgi:hypothetical protein